MKRIALLAAWILAAVGCASPTGPSAKAGQAKSQLEAASQTSAPSARLAGN
jgi:hypothetical protein